MNELARYLRGGAASRADSITGLDPRMQNALAAMFAAAPDGYLTINSGFRSPELQAQLYQQALQRYGSEAEARRWVAPPGRSQHNHGRAVDLGFANDEARQWAHENAARFGLVFPLSNEAWHLELAGARDMQQAPTQGAVQPQVPPSQGQGAASQPAPPVAFSDGRREPGNALTQYYLDPAAFMSQGFAPVPVVFDPRRFGSNRRA